MSLYVAFSNPLTGRESGPSYRDFPADATVSELLWGVSVHGRRHQEFQSSFAARGVRCHGAFAEYFAFDPDYLY